MLLHSIRLSNFLSYGAQSDPIALGPLNVIIGPNGSGKSNLLEAIDLLKSTPKDLVAPIREGGGVHDWIWKGGPKGPKAPFATLEAFVENPKSQIDIRYSLTFTEVAQRFQIIDERIENSASGHGNQFPYLYYSFGNGQGVLNSREGQRRLQHEDIEIDQSILSQRKDPDKYPELTYLGNAFSRIRLYREWIFGRSAPPRLPQSSDLPNDMLVPDASNLGLVLNRFGRDPEVKRQLLRALGELYDGIDDYHVNIEGGSVQAFLVEGKYTIPATRLSDGTLRYLCLLAILCHPQPPPLIAIEEPELGLHPDVLPAVARLLKEAATRTQIIVTTHSDLLVDAMTDCPEAVLVAKRTQAGTSLTRLDAQQLQPWLQDYRLGQLWTRGEIGGTRW